MRTFKIIAVFSLFISQVDMAKAQFNPLLSQYYNNTYLGNPAFAGVNRGVQLHTAYSRQWTNIPGSPEVQSFTGTFGSQNEKVGLGLNVNFDNAGLQKVAKVLGTYAYHLPLNNAEQKLHFGVSLGFMNQRLSTSSIIGNTNDPLAMRYNERATFINGDFGIAYTSKKLKLEVALPNLNQLLQREAVEVADLNTFYTAVSYVIALGSGMDEVQVEPKVAYRGVKKMDNVWDVGTQVTFANEQVMLVAIYHITQSASFGLGTNFRKKYLISANYTSETGALRTYTNGTFELNLGIRLGK